MKSITLDTSSIISLATNNLLWLFKPLKEKFGGNFYITDDVKREIIENPLKTKKFRLEAMQVMAQVAGENLKIYSSPEINEETRKLCNLANKIFKARGEFIRIVHAGEMSALALGCKLASEACVIDERTTRVLIENPKKLSQLLGRKLHTPIKIDENGLIEFSKSMCHINIIRSAELAVIAYELGLLDRYAMDEQKKICDINLKRNVLDGALWGVKLRGCSISSEEISQILEIEGY